MAIYHTWLSTFIIRICTCNWRSDALFFCLRWIWSFRFRSGLWVARASFIILRSFISLCSSTISNERPFSMISSAGSHFIRLPLLWLNYWLTFYNFGSIISRRICSYINNILSWIRFNFGFLTINITCFLLKINYLSIRCLKGFRWWMVLHLFLHLFIHFATYESFYIFYSI